MGEGLFEIFALFFKLGLISWGGGQSALAEIQRQTVAMGWLTEMEFAEAFAIGQLSPGPGALFIVPVGYKAAGAAGAAAAALGYLVPTALIALGTILVWGRIRTSRWPSAMREATIPTVLGLSIASAYVVGQAILVDTTSVALAGISTLVLWRTKVPIAVVLVAGTVLGTLILSIPGISF